MNRSKKIVRVSFMGIAVNVILVIFKMIVGLLANSIAIILDAINNLSDALSSFITIVGTFLAGKRPDKKHPYGYGRIEYFFFYHYSNYSIICWYYFFKGVFLKGY